MTTTRTFTVTGMTCGNCERHVQHAAAKVPGVSAVAVDRPGNRATVTYDADVTSPAAIAAAITDAGYEAAEASGGASGGASGRW
jgi:copper chaperone CopZ